MPFLTADGLTIHHRLCGTPGRPRAVFLNSLGSDMRIWDEVAGELAPDFEMLLCDGRGHGLTDAPPAPYTIEELADDGLALMDAIGWSAASLVGLSVGGVVAQEIAIRAPGRVEALVLMDTAARIGSAEMWAARIAAVEAGGLASIGSAVMERWFSPDFAARRPAELAGWRNMLERTPAAGYLGTCAALRDADLTGRVEAISAPTLVLAGELDLSTPPDLVRATAERIARARFEIVPGAGHLPCVESPALVAGLIRDHLKGARHG